jgi:hypothetical protein
MRLMPNSPRTVPAHQNASQVGRVSAPSIRRTEASRRNSATDSFSSRPS